MKKLKIVLIIITIAIIAALGYGYNYLKSEIDGNRQTKTEYNLVIERQDFKYQVSEKLEASGIINNANMWRYWMDKYYPDFTYVNGEYYLNSSMSYEELAQKLQNPDISHKIVKTCIPEGYNIFDIANVLEENSICSKDDFYKAVSSIDGYDYDFLNTIPVDNNNIGFALEGFLFPATYEFAMNSEAKDVVDQMLSVFEDHYSDEIKQYCSKNNITIYDFITLCSIVQEEALTEDSAEYIASVLVNRLNNGTKLQCDVTYYYAKQLLDYGYSRDVYDSYYTYRCKGLPTGPITNSGDSIMNAVVNHPDTDYLFFFSDLKGDFHFASNGSEFEKLKKEYPWK